MNSSVIQGCFLNGFHQPLQSRPVPMPPPVAQRATMPRGAAFPPPRPVFQPQFQPVVQRFGAGTAMRLPDAMTSAAHRSIGQPLQPAVRQMMESLFRTSFADVRVHVGPHVTAIGATSYTQGSNIHFAPGHYAPEHGVGRQRLAYELAHVVQQRSGRVRNPLGSGVAIVQDVMLDAEAARIGQTALHVSSQPPRAVQPSKRVTRPTFTSGAQHAARRFHNIFGSFRVDVARPDLPRHNAAMPHRMSWKDIRENTLRFVRGQEDAEAFERWTDRFLDAGREKIRELPSWDSRHRLSIDQRRSVSELRNFYKESLANFSDARDALMSNPGDTDALKVFAREANSFFANVPDLGPHRGVNNPVRERAHLNVREPVRGRGRDRGRARERELSPMSRRVADMSPHRLSGIAVDEHGDLITTGGGTFALRNLNKADARRIRRHQFNAVRSFDPNARFG